MNRLTVTLLVAVLMLMACAKHDELVVLDTNVRIQVKAMFGDDELMLNTAYTNVEDYLVTVEELKFYLSEISLIRPDSSELLISDIDLFDRAGNMSVLYNVPAGLYIGFKYSLGVPQELNGTNDPNFDETQYGPAHPLNLDNGMYWGWTPGYKFMRWQGRTDTLPDNTADVPLGYSLHTGLDQYYKTFEFEGAVDVSRTSLTTLVVNMDVDRFMYNQNDTLHFNTAEDTQLGPANSPLALKFFNLLDGAITSEVE